MLRLAAPPLELREDDRDRRRPATTRRSASRSTATNVSASPFEGLLGVEFAMMLLGGGHNPAAFHEVGGRRIAHDEAARSPGR